MNKVKNDKHHLLSLGKGPLKDQYLEQILREKDQYPNVEFCFPWLDADDYPLLLGKTFSDCFICYDDVLNRFLFISVGCADLGVSLHKSSSGFDLPMKVVDMFAVGVPVCSVQYNW